MTFINYDEQKEGREILYEALLEDISFGLMKVQDDGKIWRLGRRGPHGYPCLYTFPVVFPAIFDPVKRKRPSYLRRNINGEKLQMSVLCFLTKYYFDYFPPP